MIHTFGRYGATAGRLKVAAPARAPGTLVSIMPAVKRAAKGRTVAPGGRIAPLSSVTAPVAPLPTSRVQTPTYTEIATAPPWYAQASVSSAQLVDAATYATTSSDAAPSDAETDETDADADMSPRRVITGTLVLVGAVGLGGWILWRAFGPKRRRR